MSADNLRERLSEAGREGPLDPYLTAELAIPVFREWLTSDAAVERVARRMFERASIKEWSEQHETTHVWFRDEARAALAAALAPEEAS